MVLTCITDRSGLSQHAMKLSFKRAYIVKASSSSGYCARGTIAAAASTISGFIDVSSTQCVADDLRDMLSVNSGRNLLQDALTNFDPGVWKGLSGCNTDTKIVAM